ncbi:MAG: hypothetical protein GX242_04030 [Clostridiales bacterium]|nr:hypothetical protein [Clostridiales bacterium]
MLIKITNDLYDIAFRIKEIDDRYQIFYDTDKCKYKLYLNSSYQLTFPYDNLDARSLDYAYETRMEHIEKILEKIDKHNERIMADGIKKAKDDFENKVSRLL